MSKTYDHAWQRLRRIHLARNALCVRCGAQGVHVDHVVTVRQAPARRLDPTNLQTLCHACHNKVTAYYDGPAGAKPRGANSTGLPIAPDHPWHRAALEAGQVTTTDVKHWHKGRPVPQQRRRDDD